MPAHRTKLTPRQALFAQEYPVDFNATQAARRAGYASGTAVKIGHKLLLVEHVQAAIREQLEERTKRTHITQDRVLQELAALAFFDVRKLFAADGSPIPINELDDATAAAINGLDVLEQFEGSGENRQFVGAVKKYRVTDKNTALSNVMKHLGMLKETLAVTGANGGAVELDVKQSVTLALSAAIKARLKGA